VPGSAFQTDRAVAIRSPAEIWTVSLSPNEATNRCAGGHIDLPRLVCRRLNFDFSV
jgi:hypothetical protein